MKKFRPVLIRMAIVTGLLAAVAQAHGQGLNIPQNEAKDILGNFALANDDINAPAIGLPTGNQLRNARIVNPRRVYLLEIGTLKAIDKTNGVIWTSLRHTYNVVYEVRDANNRILALLETEKAPGLVRRVLSLGNKAMALALTGDSAQRRRSEIIVRVPALYMEFVTYQTTGAQSQRFYIPLGKYSEAGLTKGAKYNDKTLRNKIKPLADAYEGWPE